MKCRIFLQLCPENAEDYIEFLQSIDRLDESAQRLAAIVNDDKFVSKKGKSNHQVQLKLFRFPVTIDISLYFLALARIV